ncbi:T9SS type A sorting domain-containing protein, partial [bacterium]|nr:T9SS type A sorting domain-containing protein [bacterium]
LSDTTDIKFKVLNINSAPVLTSIPSQRFNEDESLELGRTILEGFVNDEDNEKSEMTFRLINNPNIHFAATATNGMRLFTEPNWCGVEVVTMVVNDGAGGADSTNFMITVSPMPDAPSTFKLLSPKDMQLFQFMYPQRFLWEQVEDPDPGDRLSYWLLMSNSAAFTDTLASVILPYHDSNYYDYYTPVSIPKGTYFWKMYVMDMWGNTVECEGPAIFITLLNFDHPTAVDELPETKPMAFELYQNHPNPFNPETLIRYDLPVNSQVQLTVFNTLGREVRHLVNQEQSAGAHEMRWNALDDYGNAVTSGVYIYQIRMGEMVQYKKMLLLQ